VALVRTKPPVGTLHGHETYQLPRDEEGEKRRLKKRGQKRWGGEEGRV